MKNGWSLSFLRNGLIPSLGVSATYMSDIILCGWGTSGLASIHTLVRGLLNVPEVGECSSVVIEELFGVRLVLVDLFG